MGKIMTYGLKYTTGEYTRQNGSFELRIYMRDYVGDVQTMENLQSLNLELQGGTEAIDSPIIKTSLSWSLVDEQTKADEGLNKYGHWEEFFTPDSTLYKVVLLQNGSVMWSGYITPDSMQDDLCYNSSITFIARDNLGHLADFTYDKDEISSDDRGLISVKQIIEHALSLIEFPMSFSVYDTSKWLQVGDNDGYNDFFVEPDLFEDKNWDAVLEDVLSSFGLVLRYIGNNTLTLVPLRFLPDIYAVSKQAQFINNSGTRSLDPAYKKIIESGSYKLLPDDAPIFESSDFIESTSSIGTTNYTLNKKTWEIDDPTFYNAVRPLPDDEYILSDVAGEEGRYALIRGDNRPCPQGLIRHRVRIGTRTAATLNITFDHIGINVAGEWLFDRPKQYVDLSFDVFYRLRWMNLDGSVLAYTNGAWKTISNPQEESFTDKVVVENMAGTYINPAEPAGCTPVEINMKFTTPQTPGSLWVDITPIGHNWDNHSLDNIVFVRMANFSVSKDPEAVPQGWKVTTIYDEKQNLIVRREPIIGVAPEWLTSPGTLQNAIYTRQAYDNSYCAYNAQWGGEQLSLPIPVFSALQYLTYSAKTNSVFSGEMRESSGAFISFNEKWETYGRKCLLIGGTLDIITGNIYGAILREYDTYEDIWGGISDVDFTMNTGGQGSYGGASAAGSGGGGTSSSGGQGKGDKSYTHSQDTPSAEWVIEHRLGKIPSVTIINSNGDVVMGDVNIDTTDPLNKLTISFKGEFSGKAIMN